jgi:hypothetical protein
MLPAPPPELRLKPSSRRRVSRCCRGTAEDERNLPMTAACAAATKRMATKNLETNMVMTWFGFSWVIDVLERNLSSVLYLLSYILQTREVRCWTHSISNPTSATIGFSSQGFQNNVGSLFLTTSRLLLPSLAHPASCPAPSSLVALCLRSLRCVIRRLLASLGIQSPAASSIIRGPSLTFTLRMTGLHCSMASEASLSLPRCISSRLGSRRFTNMLKLPLLYVLIDAKRADSSTISTFVNFSMLQLFVGLLGGSTGLRLASKSSKNGTKDHPVLSREPSPPRFLIWHWAPTPGGSQPGNRPTSLEADPAIGVSVGSGDTSCSTDGLVDTATALVLIHPRYMKVVGPRCVNY